MRLKGNNDIVVYEDLTGEVHYCKHLPQPNNLNRWFSGNVFFSLFISSVYFNLMCKLVLGSLLSVKLERWLQLMLKWSPQERGKDPEATPNDCFSQLGVILQLKVYYPFYLFLFFLGACKTFSTIKKNQLTYAKCKSPLSVNYLCFFFLYECAFPPAGSCPKHDVG